ncbi:MAG: chromosomal replication initiator protein DnaA [Hyphomicrobiales bacterium]|nr:MAG: chromosomal replication initiator protein DnaA [Hyphomicrobiales bacterium]
MESGDLSGGWDRVRTKLRAQVGEKVYSSWFTRMKVERFEGGTLVLSLPTRFLCNWIRSHYLDRILLLWQAELPEVRLIELYVRQYGRPGRGNNGVAAEAAGKPATAPAGAAPAMAPARPERESANWRQILLQGHGGANPSMTFEGFISSRSNEISYTAARRAVEYAPDQTNPYNPLYIHGGVGVGKTHLLNAIAAEICRRSPDLNVLFLSAERFMFSFVAALRAKDILEFKNTLRAVDVLLIDDMQFLQGASVQREFCHTFNDLIDTRRQVVVAGDLPPSDLDKLDSRMRSRLAGGLVTQIEAPDFVQRKSILERKITELRQTKPDFNLPPDTVEFVARRIAGSGRDMVGALNRMVAMWDFAHGDITPELAARAIRDLLPGQMPEQISIADIHKVVIDHFKISKAELLSTRRHQSIARPRQIAMFLAKELTTRSLPEIGRRFGGKDHTTVLYAVRRIRALMEDDRDLTRTVSILRQSLGG